MVARHRGVRVWVDAADDALQRVHLDDVRSDDVRSVASAQRNGIVLQVLWRSHGPFLVVGRLEQRARPGRL